MIKSRDFTTDNYLVDNNSRTESIQDDPNWLFQDENIWSVESGSGTYIKGNYEAPNNFEAKSNVYAVYAMGDMRFLDSKLRVIYGARIEKSDMFYTGENNSGSIAYVEEKTFDETDILPAANLVYSLSENINFRASYGKTLARPSFKEKSIAQIADPVAGVLFNGNIDLEKTTVDNFDLRVENFFGNGEMFSVSAFYKKFDGHIETTRFEVDATQITPRNVAGSFVYGLEFEFRKNLDFVASGLSLGSNVSVSHTEVDITEVFVNEAKDRTEYEVRSELARTGETVEDNRPMAGQAPYLINAFLNYADLDEKYNLNLSYNVQGESLAIVGSGNVPDTYERSFHALNLNVSRNFGLDRRSKLTFGVNNILGSKRQQFYKNYGAVDQIASLLEIGTMFSLKYGLTF